MLQIFRDKSQSIFIQAIVLVIALVFIFWGVGANMMDSREAAIVVNDEEISFQEYQRLYDQLLSSYRQQLGGAIPDELLKSIGLSEQVKSQLIQQTLLRQGAVEMGLLVSAPEVQQHIQNMVQFQENNAFNIEKYKAILASNRMTPRKFEDSQRTDLLASKGVKAIGNFVTVVTDAEINDLYRQIKETITLDFTKISPVDFINKVTINEADLASWFEKNKDNYKSEPKIKLKFLSFQYNTSPTTTDNTPSERGAVFQKANSAYEAIIAAGSLQEYARLYPDAVIQETGFFSRSTPPESLDTTASVLDTAFALKAGELSSLIESPEGYSILFAEAIQAPVTPSLDEVKKQATEDYRVAQSKIMAAEKSSEILKALQNGAKLTEAAKTEGFTAEEVTLSRDSQGKETKKFPLGLLRDIFSLNTSNPFPNEPAKIGEDFYLYQFVARTLPDPVAMSPEEKEQIKAQIFDAKQERILVAWIRNREKAAEIYTNKNIQ